MDDRTVPRLLSVRLDTLALSSTEAFVLSQVDGAATLEEVADATGLPLDSVLTIARKLEQLGAIERPSPAAHVRTSGRYADVAPSIPPPQRTSVPKTPVARSSRKISTSTQAAARSSRKISSATHDAAKSSRKTSSATHDAANSSRKMSSPTLAAVAKPGRPSQAKLRAPAVAASVVDQTCDLDAETCARIDAALAAQAKRTHYVILDVPPTASAKEISRAYFAVVATLHPDRYFRKRLGPYKKKLEQAFRTATDSYDVLRSSTRRAEYDGYLRLTRKSVEMEAALTPPRASVPAPPPSAPRASVPLAAPRASVPPVAPPRASPAPVAPIVPVAPAPPTISIVPAPPVSKPAPPAAVEVAAPISTPNVSTPPASNPAPTTQRISFGHRLAGEAKSASLLEEAQRALLQGDVASAANLYRLALQFAENPSVRAYAESGLKEARSMVADTHLKRALYEEKESRWSDAVASYEKALDRRPDDPAICERLANALRQEGQDLARATQLAELAVARTPRSAGYKRTLGLIYADAGSREKAIVQFEAALEIEPTDEGTNRALATLRKGRR